MAKQTIHLSALLARLNTHRAEREERILREIGRRAARLAMDDPELQPDVVNRRALLLSKKWGIDLPSEMPNQAELLRPIADGRLLPEKWKRTAESELAYASLLHHRSEAQRQIAEETGECIDHCGPWWFLFQEIHKVIGIRCSESALSEYAARVEFDPSKCLGEGWGKGALKDDDELTARIGQLHDEGYTQEWLAALWDQFPGEAAEMGLPHLPTATRPPDVLTGEAKALALLVQHPEWTDKQIAENVPCYRTTLYDWDQFKTARQGLRRTRRELPNGSKDAHGNIEAWDSATD